MINHAAGNRAILGEDKNERAIAFLPEIEERTRSETVWSKVLSGGVLRARE